MNLTPAQSQKAADCPISFVLDARGGAADEVALFIRPEDLTRSTPSRMSINQTLGGAWVDSFGEGLEAFSISGTLGWRTGPNGEDGAARLKTMRDKTFAKWHSMRQRAVDIGDDPNGVKLRFVDTLNNYTSVIAPQMFEIRRSKSRPLLASYRITFIALGKGGESGIPLFGLNFGGLGIDVSGFGLDSLFSSLNEINGFINTARNFVDRTILAPVQNFMRLSGRVFSAVHGTIQNGLSLGDPLINVARSIAQTGLNVFRTMAAVANIPISAKAMLMQVAGAYSNIFCVLKNALKNLQTYENYNPLYGSSNCSSTGGGLPPSQYAGQNPFFAVAPQSSGAVGVSPRAATALGLLTHTDIVIAPLPLPTIASTLEDVTSGVTF
jgi:hypothetical protein